MSELFTKEDMEAFYKRQREVREGYSDRNDPVGRAIQKLSPAEFEEMALQFYASGVVRGKVNK